MTWFNFHFADFSFSFLSILLEGVPFLLLGAVIAGLVDVFIPAQWFSRVLPKNPTAAVFFSGLLGGIFPMCECGSVIVIRRFLAKGLPVSCAVTYMLAAPIVSPLVVLSTVAAFRGQSPWSMTFMRVFLGYAVAVGVGLIIQRLRQERVLQPGVLNLVSGKAARSNRAGVRVAPAEEAAPIGKTLRVVRAATSDFLDVTLFFVIGAGVAALFNTAVDQSLILPLASSAVYSVLAMMGLAAALALCSSTDAFIAASFVAFPFTAKLAFLVFGPLFDVKLFFLYGLIFRRWFVCTLAVGLFVAIALFCIRMSVLNL